MWGKTGVLMGIVTVLVALSVGLARAAGASEAGEPGELLSSPTASLTVTKAITSAAGEGGNAFSFGGSLGEFRLADGESVTFAGLAPGSYTVAEALPAGWQLDGVTCLGVEPQVSAEEASMTITLQEGQPAACTFRNYQEQVAGPELPYSGLRPFMVPLLIAGLWAVLAGLALGVWSVFRRAERT